MEKGKVKILIVEDSKTQAIKLQYILEKNNYTVLHAENALVALNHIHQFHPDIIISDVIMPGMDGYEFCKQVKEDEEVKDTPVLLLTSLSDPEDIIKGLEAKADNFITKPYNEKLLISRIHHILINKEIRASGRFDFGVEVYFAGNKYFLNSQRMQIIDLLLSTYENAIQQKIELEKSYQQLQLAHETIKTLEFNYRTLLERNTDAMIVVNQEEIILYANPAAETLFNRNVVKLIGEKFLFPVKDGDTKEIDILHDNEQIIIAEMRVTGITWKEEKAFLATLRDVTENAQLRGKLQNMSITDELTGVNNRRGFLTRGELQFKATKEKNQGIMLLSADLDNLKSINDTLGHHEGDKALMGAADVLKETFRDSDIIGRIGGDEFVVLVIGTTSFYEIINRLQRNLDKYNSENKSKYNLSFSIGIAVFDYNNPNTLEELLIKADKEMYKQKIKKINS